MLDNVVTAFGTMVENALQERVEVEIGNKKESRPLYKLTEILKPDFSFQRPGTRTMDAPMATTDGGMKMDTV